MRQKLANGGPKNEIQDISYLLMQATRTRTELYAFAYVYCHITYTAKDKSFEINKMKRLNKLHYTKATYKAALRSLYAQLSTCLLIEILNAQEKKLSLHDLSIHAS